MNIVIENKKFKAEISSFGAEIKSFVYKKDGTEIIWNGDNEVWGYHAPILFPFVDKCVGGFYLIEGKRCEYTKNHGFARNLDTKVVFTSPSKAVFELSESEETLCRYPYKFSLITEYEMTDSGLNWKITVKNNDVKAFKFALGTHPAFACPRNTDSSDVKISDYVIEFENKKSLSVLNYTEDGFILTDDNKIPLSSDFNEKNKGFIPVSEKGFGNGILFDNIDSEWIGLRNTKNNSLVSVCTKNFPCCMLWQNEKGAPQFVCIEPWYGLPDIDKTSHIWNEKIGLNELLPGMSFESIQNICYKC